MIYIDDRQMIDIHTCVYMCVYIHVYVCVYISIYMRVCIYMSSHLILMTTL